LRNVVRVQLTGGPFWKELILDEDRGLLFVWSCTNNAQNKQLVVYHAMHNAD